MAKIYTGGAVNQHSIFAFRRNPPNFDKPYMFAVNNTITITTFGANGKGGGRNLRVSADDKTVPTHNGGNGDWARWTTELQANDKTLVRFKSVVGGKYLRIHQNGSVDVAGGQGPYTLFKFHKTGEANGAVQGRLQSVEFKTYLCVGPDEPFTKRYQFAKVNTVVLRHVEKANLRVDPNNLDECDTKGGLGIFAHFQAEPQNGGNEVKFKSVKSGKYLRIGPGGNFNCGGGGGPFTVFKVHKQGGGQVKFESKKHGGKYPAVRKGQATVGNGGQFTVFEVFRQN